MVEGAGRSIGDLPEEIVSLVLSSTSTRDACRPALSARDLDIAWGGNPEYWSWISIPSSRFAESAELVKVCWLEIRGRVAGRLLSPNTTYVAYFVYRLSEHSYGLDSPNQVVSIKAGTLVSSSEICLNPQAQEPRLIHPVPFGFRRMFFRRPAPPPVESPQIPRSRSDGWMEVPMGEFFNDDVEEVEVSLQEIRGNHWKSGLIIHGIEMRPKRRFSFE